MKTLKDIKADMSELYEQVRNGSCDLKTSAELANIAGKFLKADQLELAREVFLSGQFRQNQIPDKSDHVQEELTQ